MSSGQDDHEVNAATVIERIQAVERQVSRLTYLVRQVITYMRLQHLGGGTQNDHENQVVDLTGEDEDVEMHPSTDNWEESSGDSA